jgi:hypothetical protein
MDFPDPCAGGALLEPNAVFGQSSTFALRPYFHRAVGQIPHPSAQIETKSLSPRAVAETDALHPAFDKGPKRAFRHQRPLKIRGSGLRGQEGRDALFELFVIEWLVDDLKRDVEIGMQKT